MYFILMSVALVDEMCSTVATNIKIKQDRQCTCNVTLRRVRVTLLPWKNKTCHMFRCLCVAVGARARARTGACARVALIIQHATRRRYCHLRPFLASPIFFRPYLINGTIFGEKLLIIKCVFLFFLYNFCLKHFSF
jgi:hypothetical protein